jgi:hypothetical protein
LENETLEDVKNAVLLWSIFEFYFDADPIRESQREAYFLVNQVITPPILTTSFRANLPDNQAEIEGFVVSDGGGQIEQRGMVWAQHNNPIIEDDIINVDGSLGSYAVLIPGLVPGETYFARSFAKNAEGIAYGNNARFTAEEVSSSDEDIQVESDQISIYPNPVSTILNVRFEQEMNEPVSFQIVDISGRSVLNYSNLLNPKHGESIGINIKNLVNGVYYVVLKGSDNRTTAKKFVVFH